MTKRVLLIKLTSMGDLMHALPALTDATRAFPGIEFDWVVDEAFAEVPGWHPAVNRVIKSAHRRWRRNLSDSLFGGQLKDFYRQLNRDNYDVILDAQNNLKSAFIAALRKGQVHGLDKHSAREFPAHWAYGHHHPADKTLHAIERQRQLLAQAIGYTAPATPPDYGVDHSRFSLPPIELPERFLFFVHNASWTTKLWPEAHWHQLIAQAEAQGFAVLLPCGNDEEYARAQRLAASHDNASALPKMSLSEIAGSLSRAEGAVCCDTGLCHLAALVGTPSVSFYGPTSHQLIGATGANQQHMIASSSRFPCAPCYGRSCTIDGDNADMSACMASFAADVVWQNLSQLMADAAPKNDASPHQ